MTINLPTPVLWFAAFVTTAGGVWFLFDHADKAIRQETRSAISRWLKNVDPVSSTENWRSTVGTLIDRIFGQESTSFSFFLRSCVASTSGALLVLFLWAALRPDEFEIAIALQQTAEVPSWFLLLILIGNWLPDYLSLVETRWLLRKMTSFASGGRVAVFVVADVAATLAILLACLSFLPMAIDFLIAKSTGTPFILGDAVRLHITGSHNPFVREVFLLGPTLHADQPFKLWPAGVLFYSTFWTSIWIWVYLLSGLIAKLSHMFKHGVGVFRTVFDVDKKPLQALGYLSVLIVGLLYVALAWLA